MKGYKIVFINNFIISEHLYYCCRNTSDTRLKILDKTFYKEYFLHI